MRLLVGCRSGMTVKFASRFHHGNPFVRGLLFAGSAVPFRGALCCSMLVRYRLCEASFEARRNRCAFVRRRLCGSGIGTCKGERLLRMHRAKAIFLRCPLRRHAKGIPCVVQFRPNALNAHLRSIVHCSFYASRQVEEAGKLHCLATFALQFLLCIRLFARCYSNTSRHSKRVDARFARRTVYRPPSGELVMVLMR